MSSYITSNVSFFSVTAFNSLPSIEDAFNSTYKVTDEQWEAIAQVFKATNLGKSFKLVLLHRHQYLKVDEVMFNKFETSKQGLCISKPVKRAEIQTDPNIIPFIWKLNENGVAVPLGFTTKNSISTIEMTEAEFQYNCRILANTLSELRLLNIFGISKYLSLDESRGINTKVWVEDTNVETQENISQLKDITENFTSNNSCIYCGSLDRQPTPTAWGFVKNIIKCNDVCMRCAACGHHVDLRPPDPEKITEEPSKTAPATEPEKTKEPNEPERKLSVD